MTPAGLRIARRIAFASKRDGSVQLYTINANGENLRRVTRGVSGIGGRSSIGRRMGIRWFFMPGPPGDRDIYLIGVDGKGLRQMTDGGDNLGPSFSPDGQWIAFTSYRDGNNEIYIMRTRWIPGHPSQRQQQRRLSAALGALIRVSARRDLQHLVPGLDRRFHPFRRIRTAGDRSARPPSD